jgi:uncharacterized protein (TIGR00299 family) protein
VTKIAYFDCIAGASGDMILGALLDTGLSEHSLRRGLESLQLDGFDLDIQTVFKNGFRATKVDVSVADKQIERRLPEIEAIVFESTLPENIKNKAAEIFRKIGTVEAEIHGVPLEQVHLHELGGMDTIVDVLGALIGLDALDVSKVIVSPLPLARGFTEGAHGTIPLPAPATLALLHGIPVIGSDLNIELVTPTGAALLSSIADDFGPIPTMTLEAVGYGAANKDLPIPNVLRLLLGSLGSITGHLTENLVMLETNIDDLNPEIYEYVMTQLFEAGALDVYLSPVQMKKNRPGTLLSILCKPVDVENVMEILFEETTTLGIRKHLVDRIALHRQMHTVNTPYGPVQVKVAYWGQNNIKLSPEYEDCRQIAERESLPLKIVYQAAEKSAQDLLIP